MKSHDDHPSKTNSGKGGEAAAASAAAKVEIFHPSKQEIIPSPDISHF